MEAFAELRTNLRLRLGLVAILVILLGYGLLEWRDHLATEASEYQRLLNHVARLGQHQQPELWSQRASEAKAALTHAQAQLWRDNSTGQAQAHVQDWLFTLLRQTDAKGSSVRVTEPDAALDAVNLTAKLPPELQGLRPLRARVEFNSDTAVLMALLAAFNDSEQQVGIDGLSIKPFKTEIVMTFWFDIPAAAATGTAEAKR